MGRKALTRQSPRISPPGQAAPDVPAEQQLYTLEVVLVSGPMSQTFAQENRRIARTIEILGSHMLDDLHNAIFQAFDRWDEHLYEFRFGNVPHDARPSGATLLASLGLTVGRTFGYWFDFGDNWHHQINVLHIDPAPCERFRYPRISASTAYGQNTRLNSQRGRLSFGSP